MILWLTLFFACPQPPPAATTSTKNQPNQPQNGQNQNPPNGGQNNQNPPNEGQNNPNPPEGGQNNGSQPSKGPPIGGKVEDAVQDQFGYPEADGEIIQNAIVIKINDSGNGDPPPRHTQEELADIPHVTFSGNITCTGEKCDSPLVLRVVPFQEQSPTGKPSKNGLGGLLTVKKLSSIGEYDVRIPKSKNAVVLELLVDFNNDGKPTVEERLAVLERGGQLIPYEDMKDLTIDCSPVDFGPIGGAVSPDAPAAKPPQKAPDTEPNVEREAPKEGAPEEQQPPPGSTQQPPPEENPEGNGENPPPNPQ